MVSHVCFLTSNDHSATGLFGFDRFDGELGGVFVFSHNKEETSQGHIAGRLMEVESIFFRPIFSRPPKSTAEPVRTSGTDLVAR